VQAFRVYNGDSSPGAPAAPDGVPFARVPDSALADSRLSDSSVRVLAAVMSYCWSNVTTVYLDRLAIGRACGKSQSAVYRALFQLEEAGYLERDRDRTRAGAPHCLVLCFRLRMPASGGVPPVTSEGLQSFSSEGLTGQNCRVDPSEVKGCNPSLLKGTSLLRISSKEEREKLNETPPAPTRGAEAHSSPASGQSDPPAGPARGPLAADEVAELLADAGCPGSPAELTSQAGLARVMIRCGVRQGEIARDLVPSWLLDLPMAGCEPAVGSSAKIPPRPAGGPPPDLAGPAESNTPERIRTSNLRFRRPIVRQSSEGDAT
jgi:DNA-binding transcriptional ArsR family regulator